jgi:hypothetical protein
MKHRFTTLVVMALLLASAARAAEPVLPAPLELRYALRYGSLTIGHVTKTLARNDDGSYQQRTHSRPEGMASWFTSVEWFEEGRFEIRQGTLRPLTFLEYRVGADKSHRHSARFDWAAHVIRYDFGTVAALSPGTQDQGSLIYSFMLHPPAPGTQQEIALSGSKKLKTYRYRYAGEETVRLPAGKFKTRVIEQLLAEPGDEALRVWLAPEHGNLPVRIATRKRGQDTILELEAASGAITLPQP